MYQKLKIKYDSLSSPVKASLWFLICGFLQKGVSLLTTPIFTRIMTEAAYGSYSVYNSWLSIVEIIISLNLAAGVYTRGLIKNEEDQDRFSSSMLGLSTSCIVIWLVIYCIFHKTANKILGMPGILVAAMFLEIWAHAAYQFWSNRERVNYRYKKLVALTLSYVILRPVLGVICVVAVDVQYQAIARVLATVFVNTVLFSVLYFSIFKKGKQFYNKQYWIYALKFNIPLVPHYLSQIVLSQSDRLMIDHFCGPAETAYYSVAYTMAMVLLILNNSISATMNPWIYRSIKKEDYNNIAKVSYSVLAIIAVLNFAVILMAPEMLRILAPGSYQRAVWVIPPVTTSVFFMFLYNLFATFEYYCEKTHYASIATLSGAILNIVLNAIMIPRFGFVAAGYTTLICYILYAFAHYFFMQKSIHMCLNKTSIYEIKIIVFIGAALIVSSIGAMMLYNNGLLRYVVVIGLAVIAVIKRKNIIRLLVNMKI